MLRLALGLTALITVSSGASAQSILGNWTAESGERKVAFAPCGGDICGTITWIKDPAKDKAKVGQRVFTGVKESGPGKYSGTAINPDDGKQYSGSMTVSGNTLSAGGCVLGGMICQTRKYTRG